MNTANLKYFKKDFLKSKFAIYIAAGGLVLFILVSSTFNFRDSIFSKLFPKPYSQAAGPNDWAQVQKDPQRSGFSSETIGPTFSKKWSYAFQPDRVHSQIQPIVYSNSVYVGTEQGYLYAFDVEQSDANNPKYRWRFQAGGAILHSVAADNGKVFFGAMDGAVYGIDTSSGNQVWKTQVSLKGLTTAPLLVDGKVMLGGRDGYFFGLDAESGNLIWKYDAGAPVLQTAAYDNGKAYFGSMDMYVHAVNTTDGSQAWKSAKLAGMTMYEYWPVIFQGKVIVNTHGAMPAFRNAGLGIVPGFPFGCCVLDSQKSWFSANAASIVAGNMAQITDPVNFMKAQDDLMIAYNANPSAYKEKKSTFILDATTGAETMVTPHFGVQIHNGMGNPPCVDKSDAQKPKLVVPVWFLSSGWARLDLNYQGGSPPGPRIVDILYDGKNISGGNFDVSIGGANYAAGFGNADENYGLSCSANLIVAMHFFGGGSGAGYAGTFDLSSRKWTNLPHIGKNQEMVASLQSGGTHPAAISNGMLFHVANHNLIVRQSGI